ncbi:hypothetical protein CRUP_007217, partial [Coryphaenoides rupestris]
MAMLRNLRNMITQGISEAHHKQILGRLTNKVRGTLAEKKAPPTDKQILLGILKKFPKSKRFRRFEWKTAPRKKLRVPLSVPFIYTLYKRRQTLLQQGYKCPYSVELLERYCEALEKAVQLSCRYNIPPLPGRTLIFIPLNMHDEMKTDFCCPHEAEAQSTKEKEKEEGEKQQQQADKNKDESMEEEDDDEEKD